MSLLLLLCFYCGTENSSSPPGPKNVSNPGQIPLQIITLNEPPTNIARPGRKPDGIAVDLMNAIQKAAGDSTRIQVMPGGRAVRTSRTRSNVIAFTLARTPEREAHYHWLTQVAVKHWAFIARRDSKLRIHNLNEAKQIKKIGVTAGAVREAFLVKMGFENLERVPHHRLNVMKLARGRVPAILYNEFGLAAICRDPGAGCEYKNFRVLYRPHFSRSYIVLSRKGTNPETVQKWKKAVASVKASGEFQKILTKWKRIIEERYGFSPVIKGDVIHL